MKKAAAAAALIPALIAYSLICRHLNFVQDDAFIAYRYVANFLDGHGLVFNYGEYVEGYTSFGWVALMSLFGSVGLDYIVISRLLGWLFGAGAILMTFQISKKVVGGDRPWFALIPVWLVAMNFAHAYWSQAGLETAAFAFFTLLSVYWYFRRDWLLIWSLTLGTLLRPEGALVAIILVLIDTMLERRIFGFAFAASLAALIALIPQIGFKLLYYGDLLPNPFYAKTAWSWQQVTNGAGYVGLFFKHYGFLGIGVLLAALLVRRLPRAAAVLLLFFCLYTVYILLVGGDVLSVHRFFLPLFGISAILTMLPLWRLTVHFRKELSYAAGFALAVCLLLVTVYVPLDYVSTFGVRERTFTVRMNALAEDMSATVPGRFSAATTTIGSFGYALTGHRVIDMLGLTDTVVSRHAERPAVAPTSTWKEQRYNSRYILEQAPDFIVFSTGVKPSAPAELDIVRFPQFFDCYRLVDWPYENRNSDTVVVVGNSAYRKVLPVRRLPSREYSSEYAQTLKLGLEAYADQDFDRAVRLLSEAMQQAPEANHSVPFLHVGTGLLRAGLVKDGVQALNLLLERDSLVCGAHRELYLYESQAGNAAKAAIHRRWLERLCPWSLPVLDSVLSTW